MVHAKARRCGDPNHGEATPKNTLRNLRSLRELKLVHAEFADYAEKNERCFARVPVLCTSALLRENFQRQMA